MGIDLSARLEHCYSGAVYDVLRALSRPNQVLPSTIRPLDPSRKLAGSVFTVSGHLDPTLDAHQTLLHWTAFLSKAPAGSVVVCQPNDSTLSHMGELSAETLHFRGVRGYIVDGGCRDIDFILKIGFPVFCRYFTPMDVVGRWKADTLGEPVVIGQVALRTGDFVLADRDGIVVIPAELSEEVVSRTEEVMRTENLVRKAILQGIDPQEAYLKYGKF
jgi:4-hydroxy-4-methyl-2-oxoglutarate aldolase